jgi:hypothetical protein
VRSEDGRTVTGATEEQARNRFPFGCLFRFWAIRRSCQAATAWLRSRDFGGVVGGKIQQNRRLDRMAVCTAGEIPHSFFLARGNRERELRAAVFGRFSRTQHGVASPDARDGGAMDALHSFFMPTRARKRVSRSVGVDVHHASK